MATIWVMTARSRWGSEQTGYLDYRVIGDEIEIDHVEVPLARQRQGVATALFDDLLRKYPGVRRLLLEVSVNNTGALALYEQLGFRRVGCRKKYYQDGSDAILMTKTISY